MTFKYNLQDRDNFPTNSKTPTPSWPVIRSFAVQEFRTELDLAGNCLNLKLAGVLTLSKPSKQFFYKIYQFYDSGINYIV